MKVVLDTNVIISRFLSPLGSPARIFHLWQSGSFELLVSESILSEYKKVLSYDRIQRCHKMTAEDMTQAIDGFSQFSIVVPTGESLTVSKDPDDNKFIECAFFGGADYIVSGDPHLLELIEYQGIQILTPRQFLHLF